MVTALLLVDVQPEFLGSMAGPPEPLIARLEALLCLADMVGMPTLLTRERPIEAKGDLPDRLRAVLPASARVLDKSLFDATAEESVRAALEATGCRTVAVAGAETDVCVLQTVLGLLGRGYSVELLEDCLFSSEANTGPAIARMRMEGARPATCKSFTYSVTRTVDRTAWPSAWRQELFSDPENLPPGV
ncbi:MAG: isochorismatase family protein [Planctomycetota bacterium]|jgi:nicotinamidase-related amidase